MTTALELRDVSKAYGGSCVLKRSRLAVAQGDFVAVTGPSGSGKSTLLNLCGLLDRPDTGEVLLGGESTVHLRGAERARLRGHQVGFVFQGFKLLGYRTVLENVLFRFRYLGSGSLKSRGSRKSRRTQERAQAHEVIESLGLASVAHKPARLLSGGEMQRTAIARAVVLPPEVLLADEPTGNLDGESSQVVMDCFSKLNAEAGTTIVLATHDLSLLARCNRHVACVEGTLSESGFTKRDQASEDAA